jgi:hypothetical protein
MLPQNDTGGKCHSESFASIVILNPDAIGTW